MKLLKIILLKMFLSKILIFLINIISRDKFLLNLIVTTNLEELFLKLKKINTTKIINF